MLRKSLGKRARSIALPCLGTAWLVVGAVTAGSSRCEDSRLKDARELLGDPEEAKVRQGARLCLELDDEASMALLLQVLDGNQPHKRDIAWETMPDFKDPKARALVVSRLDKLRESEALRQWCAELLGRFADPLHTPVLSKALGDKAPAIRMAAAQALARAADERAAAPLTKAAADKEPFVRAYAREALARLDPGRRADLLRKGLDDDDAGVRCFLLGCVPAVLPEEIASLSLGRLKDPDWRVRAQAAENLTRVRTLESIDALIEVTGDVRPRVAQIARGSLTALTGERWHEHEAWKRWWEAQRGSFDPTKPAKEPQSPGEGRSVSVRYNDLPVESDHVAFLLDVSDGMRERLQSQEASKKAAACAELARVLEQLQDKVTFNVFVYDTTTRPFSEEAVPLDARSAKKALAFVEDANPRGPKDIWQALITALADTQVDTLYLMASGEPEIGVYVHYNRIVEHLRELQRFHKTVVHGVVYTDSDWYAKQIEEICKATGGEYRRVR
jgi:HEAT repeat protein